MDNEIYGIYIYIHLNRWKIGIVLRGSPPKIYVGHFHWFKNNKIVIHRYFSYIFWGNGPFWHPQVPYPRQFPGRDREHFQEFFIVRQP